MYIFFSSGISLECLCFLNHITKIYRIDRVIAVFVQPYVPHQKNIYLEVHTQGNTYFDFKLK